METCSFHQLVFLSTYFTIYFINYNMFFLFCFVAVVMSELVKLVACIFLVFREEGSTFTALKHALHNTIIKQPMDTLKVCVPSMIYVIQNNLLYVAASHLDAATYQVSSPMIFLPTLLLLYN